VDRHRIGISVNAVAFALFAALGAFAGAAVGSYSGVVAGRGWRGSLSGRSVCDGCDRSLRWWELLPVASYLALRGRCSRCGSPIPPSLLVRELSGAVVGGSLALLAVVVASR
jgi:leader peptidase (prepilin peptidase)/N-methyltransferase